MSVLEVKETGIPFIDFSLGEFSGGQILLFTSDSSTLNDAIMLSMLVTFNMVEKGMSCVAIQTDEPYLLASKKFAHVFLPEKFPLLMEKMNEGRFIYLDLVSGKDQSIQTSGLSGVKLVENNLDRILYDASQALDLMMNNFTDNKVIVLYHNISSSMIDFDSKPVLRMLKKLVGKIKQDGNIFVGVVNRDIHESEVTNTLKHFASYVVELGLEMKDGSPHPFLQVSKTPIIGVVKRILHKKLAYHISGDKFETFSPISFYLDELEDGQVFYQKGEVSILGTKTLVFPISFLASLLKTLENNIDYELYRKIVLEIGVKFGAKNVRAVESEFKLKDDRLLISTLRYAGARGYAKLLDVEGELKSGRIKIRIHSWLAEEWGKSNKPVCVLIAGGLQGIVEEVSSKKWICKETRCIAMGDDYCEFDLTQV